MFGLGVGTGWALGRRWRVVPRGDPPPNLAPEARPESPNVAQASPLEEELNGLIYSVSHDLRAPLRGIDGFSRALEEDYGPHLDATAQGYLQRVRANVGRVNGQIENLLTLARFSRAELRLAQVDVSALVAGICEDLARQHPGRRLVWTVQPQVHARADPALLTEGLRRLLENAWKFSAQREAATVDFSAQAGATGAVYAVRDNGAGFDPKLAGKLFGAFQRLHPPEQFGGDGIGLAAVRRIVHQHGGRIWAEGVPDRGATFYFTLGNDAARAA